VQDIVVGNKSFTDVAKPNEIVSLLLNDDELANLESQGSSTTVQQKKSGANGKKTTSSDETSHAVRDLWQEEGDDFFGQGGAQPAVTIPEGAEGEEDSSTPAPVVSGTRGKKRRGGGPGSRGGRKAGTARGAKRRGAAADTMAEEF
jgi:DNA helicase INO80